MRRPGPGSTVSVVDSDGEALEFAAEADVVLGFVTPQLYAAAPNLRWVHAIASGVNRYLYPAFRDGEVLLTSEKGQVGPQLADHAFALLLALTRKVASAIRLGPEAWEQRRALRMEETELTGKVMGIVGYGGTGRAVAQRATAFGMRSLALDRDALEGDEHVEAVWPMQRFQELLEGVGRGRGLLPAHAGDPRPVRPRGVYAHEARLATSSTSPAARSSTPTP